MRSRAKTSRHCSTALSLQTSRKQPDAVDDGLDVTDMLYSVTAVNMAGAHKQVKRGSVLAQDVCGHWEIMTADEWELRKDDTISDGSSEGL